MRFAVGKLCCCCSAGCREQNRRECFCPYLILFKNIRKNDLQVVLQICRSAGQETVQIPKGLGAVTGAEHREQLRRRGQGGCRGWGCGAGGAGYSEHLGREKQAKGRTWCKCLATTVWCWSCLRQRTRCTGVTRRGAARRPLVSRRAVTLLCSERPLVGRMFVQKPEENVSFSRPGRERGRIVQQPQSCAALGTGNHRHSHESVVCGERSA